MSFALPFVGPAISAIGGIFNRGGGAAMRQATQTTQNAEGGLQDVFGYAKPTSQAGYSAGTGQVNSGLNTAATGTSTLASPLSYWQRIASGNRPAVMGAVAPETNAAMQQSDAARRQAAAAGTARGGGLAAPNAEAKTNLMTQINNMLFGVRNQAPGEISKIGQSVAQIGLNTSSIGEDTIRNALQLLGLGSSAEQGSGTLANQSMAPNMQASTNTTNAGLGAAGAALGKAKAEWPALAKLGL